MKFSRWLAPPVSAVLLLVASCGGEAPPGASRNLVLICLDTVRFDTFFLPEQAGLTDPLGDDLEQAVVFTRAQAAAPWTVPSVATVLTGLYPAQHGAGRFEDAVANLDKAVPTVLDGEIPTVTERLSDHGYATVLVTSHPWLKDGYGLERGFDAVHARKGDGKLTARAMEWLREQRSEPFFLSLHLMKAHEWHTKGERYDEFLAAADPDVLRAARGVAPVGICDGPDNKFCRRWQVYTVAVMDQRRLVAQTLDTLREQGLMDSTVVALYSDHGEEFHDHLDVEQRWQVDPRGFYGIGHGQSLYQEQLHVPLVVWHPELTAQAADQVVSLVDLAPTLMDWLGVPMPWDQTAGRRISDLQRATAPPFEWANYSARRWPAMDREIYASGIAYGPEQIAVLSDGWKYIWHEATGETNLFNLQSDPGEHRPVDDADVVADLELAMDGYFSMLQSSSAQSASLSEEQLRELKGVGYLQGVEEEETSGEGEDPR